MIGPTHISIAPPDETDCHDQFFIAQGSDPNGPSVHFNCRLKDGHVGDHEFLFATPELYAVIRWNYRSVVP
jgi:hypothetical protein